MRAVPYLLIAALLAAVPALATPKRALFDNTHAETAGNADWVIDDQQPLPVPDQSTIGPATARTVWTGAISSWGLDLVKRGYQVATLTTTYGITYGNPANAYDLSNFDVFIVDEPNTRFSAAESTAIFAFVREGGGLIAVVDHYQSDRNSDGWDSPMIWNALDSQRLFGVRCGVNGDANNNIVQTSANVNVAATDSIIHGPVGDVTGLAFHNGTTFTLHPAVNPTVRGEVWMNGLPQTGTTGLMAASAVYGNGRVVYVGDSSPADDGSANPGNSNIYDGWGEAGATDSTLFMNATLWATRRAAAPVVWTLTASAGAGGSVAPAGAVSVVQGASQRFDITPTAGYQVSDVQVDAVPVGAVTAYTFTNVGADHTLSAWFADVAPPVVRVTSPAGGEVWERGSVQSVTWTAGDNALVDSVNVDYSLTGLAGPWLPIAHGLPNPGSAVWTLPAQTSDSARVRVTAFDHALNEASATSDSAFRIVAPAAGVEDEGVRTLTLARPRPNPSRGSTSLRFSLPEAGHARLEVVDLAGRSVWRVEGEFGAGAHTLRWSGDTIAGGRAGAGLFFVRLVTPWGTRTERHIRLR